MLITEVQFQAYLHCETKAYLKSIGTVTAPHEFTNWRRRTEEVFKQKCLSRLRAEDWDEGCFAGTPSPYELKARKYHLVTDCVLQTQEFESHIHLMERIDVAEKTKHSHYVPIRFIPTEKITSFDKLLLAYDALALTAVLGKKPAFGKIIHGSNQRTTKVKLTDLIDKVKAIIGKISAHPTSAPPLILNRHCTECEFKTRCRQIAVEKDELSLLSGMSAKERKQQHSEGIFTVTQLSYTYRPRRRPKRQAAKPDNYSPALRALAIRENKIHIAGSPKLNLTGTPIYLDVEGVPDRDFYYLIGLRIKDGDSYIQHSFWANDVSEEKEIWTSFLNALAQIENPQLVHYGSYETTFLKQMKQRYGNGVEGAIVQDQLIKDAVNVLSAIYAQIYFPTHSNSLKDIAPYLGFQWSESDSSGLTSLYWRAEWEYTEKLELKQKLVTYNAQDCEALERVADTVARLCQRPSEAEKSKDRSVIYTDAMKRENQHKLANFDSSVPELKYVNQAAYWDYQREKVYIRSNKRLKSISGKSTKGRTKLLPVNKTIECLPPSRCPKCKAKKILRVNKSKLSKVVYDLKFSPTGIKRWVVRQVFYPYSCCQCGVTFYSEQRPLTGEKYGPNILAYIIHHIIDSKVSQIAVTGHLNLFFNFRLERQIIKRQKARAAEKYQVTYENILDKLIKGRLIHADETRVSIGGEGAYVWVFTSLEEVIYYYRETREGDFLHELLGEFKGVLVSDFYTAYDSVACPQQKCLIHLIRDLNDDLYKHPFNEELKRLVQGFAVLLKSIVGTIDHFGLKARFLRKHKAPVEQFYREISKHKYQSEIVSYYQDRFVKNRHKLFTFLDYDGVPWNNNNAEHAVKAFASIRNIIGGASTEKGIREYLTLLSICETCKYKGVSFLDFLRSGEKDIDTFIKTGKTKTKKTSISK